jgi:nickel-dependent lactate racemase
LSSPHLIDLASPSTRVCIVFTDATRACPDDVLVPAILRELERAGVPDDHITLLCATGMHRPSTREEKIAKLGHNVVERYRVIDHDPSDCVIPPRRTRRSVPATRWASAPPLSGHGANGTAVRNLDLAAPVVGRDEIPRPFGTRNDTSVNALLVDSDLIIATGVVEPHQYAGYSGGGRRW